MAITSGFFNSINKDRIYDAVQMSSMFDGIINDGILSTYGDKFIVKADYGMNLLVGTGKAWFRHTWTLNDTVYNISLDASDPTKKRIDLIYLEVNNSERLNSIKVKKGEYAEKDKEAEKPALDETDTMKEYPLAYVSIKEGLTEITEADIENAIGTEACPFANGLMEQITTDELCKQWNAQFVKWWDTLRETMQPIADDRSTELQNEIDSMRKWIKACTIPAGSNSYIIENPYINENSIIDIYYNQNSIKEASAKNPTYTIEIGKIIINFDSPIINDIVIDSIHVIEPYYTL